MDAADRQAHWQQVYATKDETRVSWFQDRPEASLALIRAAGVGRGEAVVDVGGGASRLVDHLLDLGVRVTVLDVAEAALAKARARLGERAAAVTWLVADVTRWQPAGRCALWHDRAVFHFLTDEEDRRAYARSMAQAVAPGGHAVVGAFAPDGPERCSGLPVRRYDAPALAREFAPAFDLVEERADDHITPAGAVQRFRFALLRRR